MNFYHILLAILLSMTFFPPAFATPTTHPSLTSSHVSKPKVSINHATLAELKQIKGITLPKARGILAYRQKHQGIKSLTELAQIPGFKRMKAALRESISQHLTL